MNYSDYRVRKYWGEKQNLLNIFTLWGFGTACKNKFVFIALLAVFAIIILAFAPLQRTAGVHIVSNVSISQGATENNSEMESVKVHGTFWNEGDIIAKNVNGIVIFTDAAHNKVVRKNIPISGDLDPNKGSVMEFDSDYTRQKTGSTTDVNVTVQFDWMENGQIKTTEILISSDEPDSLENNSNNTGKLIYGSAIVEGIEIMVHESFPVQIRVNARGYLPDGCTKIDEITKEIKDNTFIVSIKTVRPLDTFCTEAIVPYQEVISLDVYGRKAGIYTVNVNSLNGTFELATDNIIRE